MWVNSVHCTRTVAFRTTVENRYTLCRAATHKNNAEVYSLIQFLMGWDANVLWIYFVTKFQFFIFGWIFSVLTFGQNPIGTYVLTVGRCFTIENKNRFMSMPVSKWSLSMPMVDMYWNVIGKLVCLWWILTSLGLGHPAMANFVGQWYSKKKEIR